MPAAFDAVASAQGTAVSSLSFSHTCTGSDLLLTVGAGRKDNVTLSSITYNSVTLTNVGSVSNTGGAIHLQRLVAPATGANTVTVTYSGNSEVAAGSISVTGVDQTTPVGTFASATGTSTAPSVNVAGATGDLVVDALYARDGPTATVGAGQTDRWNRAPLGRFAGSTEDGAATVTMSWTLGASKAWGICGVACKAAAAGGGTTFPSWNWGGGGW